MMFRQLRHNFNTREFPITPPDMPLVLGNHKGYRPKVFMNQEMGTNPNRIGYAVLGQGSGDWYYGSFLGTACYTPTIELTQSTAPGLLLAVFTRGLERTLPNGNIGEITWPIDARLFPHHYVPFRLITLGQWIDVRNDAQHSIAGHGFDYLLHIPEPTVIRVRFTGIGVRYVYVKDPKNDQSISVFTPAQALQQPQGPFQAYSDYLEDERTAIDEARQREEKAKQRAAADKAKREAENPFAAALKDFKPKR
jgi:hypothetical protein